MLSNLKIENIAVIEAASIDFTDNFNCLSGETGAGKSIIIDSINAVLGEKTSRELIRSGADSAKVTALFCDISDEIVSCLEALDIRNEEDRQLLISRSLFRDGKNVCKINGEPCTVSMLKSLGTHLISIHGQSDSQDLMASENHYKYIDKIAGNENLLADYILLYEKMNEIRAEIERLSMDDKTKAQRIDLLNYQITEIEKADINPGEIEELTNSKNIAENAQNILNALNNAYLAIQGDDDFTGARDLALQSAEAISDAGNYLEGTDSLYEMANDAFINLGECANEIASFLSKFDTEGIDLDYIEERLDLYYRLTKKYGGNEQEILDYLENAKKELEEIDFSGEKAERLKKKYGEIKEKAFAAAKKLSQSRAATASVFCKKIIEELRFLEIPNIVFSIKQAETGMNPTGIDSIEFLISPNLGETPKPLVKIASGGELSRIMLAIKTVISDKDSIGTLIFDEIDAGVSGRAAGKIALKIREVARHRQVICVTHLAQIASHALSHILIEKETRDGRTYTKVKKLDFGGRVAELARIIGGIEVTDLQLRNAEEMLIQAGRLTD